jgi:hypothetical protein
VTSAVKNWPVEVWNDVSLKYAGSVEWLHRAVVMPSQSMSRSDVQWYAEPVLQMLIVAADTQRWVSMRARDYRFRSPIGRLLNQFLQLMKP